MAIQAGETTFYQAKRGIVQDGLVLNLDAAVDASYSGGTTWRDLESGNNGTLTNMTFADNYSTINGGNFTFDGTDEYVNIGSLSSLNGASQLSVSYWFKKSASNKEMIVGSQQSGLNGFWLQWSSDGNVYWNPRNGAMVNRGCPLSYTSGWIYLCGTYDGSAGTNGLKTYKDGSELSALSNPAPPTSLSSNAADLFRVGSLTNSFYSAGNIAFVSVYNRALTSDEVARNYNATRHRFGV